MLLSPFILLCVFNFLRRVRNTVGGEGVDLSITRLNRSLWICYLLRIEIKWLVWDIWRASFRSRDGSRQNGGSRFLKVSEVSPCMVAVDVAISIPR